MGRELMPLLVVVDRCAGGSLPLPRAVKSDEGEDRRTVQVLVCDDEGEEDVSGSFGFLGFFSLFSIFLNFSHATEP